MARSFRTQQPAAHAARRKRLGEAPPRIIVRKPRVGDVHPIAPIRLRNLLLAAPQHYVQGLRYVELRPRANAHIGQPFAAYRPGEKGIILYSLPLAYSLPLITLSPDQTIEPSTVAGMRMAGASVAITANRVRVRWPSRLRLGFWFWWFVLNHELGHHYRVQYRGRRPMASRPSEEAVADLHVDRLFRAFLQRGRARKNARGGPTKA
jgi:hypothetical protein